MTMISKAMNYRFTPQHYPLTRSQAGVLRMAAYLKHMGRESFTVNDVFGLVDESLRHYAPPRFADRLKDAFRKVGINTQWIYKLRLHGQYRPHSMIYTFNDFQVLEEGGLIAHKHAPQFAVDAEDGFHTLSSEEKRELSRRNEFSLTAEGERILGMYNRGELKLTPAG